MTFKGKPWVIEPILEKREGLCTHIQGLLQPYGVPDSVSSSIVDEILSVSLDTMQDAATRTDESGMPQFDFVLGWYQEANNAKEPTPLSAYYFNEISTNAKEHNHE